MLHVVTVGIDQYADSRIRALRCAAKDAAKFASLYAGGILDSERTVRSFVNAQATREALMTAIGQDLANEVEREDIALLYFACHGSPEQLPLESVGRYLIPFDTKFDRIFGTGIDLARDVSTWIARLRCRLTLVILDTCFSGAAGGDPFADGKWGRTFFGPRLASAAAPERAGLLRSAVSIQNLNLGKGKIILSAATDEQVAFEDPARGHGVFTYHLLDLLESSPSSSIDVGTLYSQLFARVSGETNDRQTPQLRGEIMGAKLPVPGR